MMDRRTSLRARLPRRWPAWLLHDTYALPIDIFRVLVGVLALAYFSSLLIEVPDFSSPDGLLDHRLLQRVFSFTRLSLFQAGLGDAFFYAVFSLACVASTGIIVGYHPKRCAAVLYLIAVSTYRWNFIVMYVDDAIMHLMLFWLLLLPIGRTLVLAQWWRDGRASGRAWLRVTVSGTALWCLLGNLCLIYLVAGLWKLESPMWKQGFALYATVRLPIAYGPDFWGPQHLPLLQVATYAALAIEPLLPLLLLLRAGHPLKWVGLLCLVAFHAGIIATLRIPFANLACLAAAVLFFREEIMLALTRRAGIAFERDGTRALDRSGKLALAFLALLTVAMTRRLPVVGLLSHPAYAALWSIGIAQDYQLFNWIDKKNWRGETHAWSVAAPSRVLLPADSLFPRSLRGVLLQAYLHDVRWMKVPEEHRATLKQSILAQAAGRYCRARPADDSIVVSAVIQRIEPTDVALKQRAHTFLMEFQCRKRQAVLCRTFVHPDRDPQCRWPAWANDSLAEQSD